MKRFLPTNDQLPEYHPNLLIVKMSPSAGALPLAAMAVNSGEGMPGAPGLSALATLERAGMIKRITYLSRPSAENRRAQPAMSFVASLAAVPERSSPRRYDAGVSIVELEHDKLVDDVRLSLAKDPHVTFAARVPVRYLAARTSIPKGQSKRANLTIANSAPDVSAMWNLQKIRWADARSSAGFTEASKIRVAVLDTGVDADHPDLKGRVNGYTFAHPDLPLASGENDIIGHGTHVSGTIGALINNNLGINGICECQLFVWKIFDDVPDFYNGTFVYFVEPVMYRRALADCLDQKIDVINLSIGGPGEPDPLEQQLFDELLKKGTTIVAAMGNDRTHGSPTSYPAAIQGVIAVGATSLDDTVAQFSNRGNHISLCAPGVAIWSTLPSYPGQFGFEAVPGPGGQPVEGKPMRRETDYDAWDGTSMATPHVTASVALLLAKRGKMDPTSVGDRLKATSDKVAAMGGNAFDSDYGAGRLNLLRLLT